MTPRALISKIDSWKPFDPTPHLNPKKPCRSDRSTNPNPNNPDNLDLSKLSLIESPTSKDTYTRWLRRKRRRGSRSVSGRSSDRHVSVSYSDFHFIAGGTDSSGELFVNEWGSDASESNNNNSSSREMGFGYGGYNVNNGSDVVMGMLGGGGVNNDVAGSGYGSEPGYRGDVELGEEDGDEEEEDNAKFMFWSNNRFGRDTDRMEVVGENSFSEQKAHHRCRRRKHDWRLIAPLR